MANEAQIIEELGFRPDDEIDELFAHANPNPTRHGCPSREVLVALAHKRRPIDDPGYEHLAECSACYREFRHCQQARLGEGTRPHSFGKLAWLVAAAAVLVMIVAGVVWMEGPQRESRVATGQAPVEQLPVTEDTVQVDLRKYTVARDERPANETVPVQLTRGRLNATILLPVGSEPGQYDVQILASSSQPQVSSIGRAEIREFVTTLQVPLDLRPMTPGSYQLALRREGEEWRVFPLLVK